MRKFIRGFFCFLLCIVLTASLIASACVLGLTYMLEEENLDDILKSISPSSKVFGYERAEADQEISFGDALREYLPIQNVSLLNLYSDVARTLTDAGIEALEEHVSTESAVNDFSRLAKVFTDGYIEKGKELGVLSGYVTYRSMYGIERDPKDVYARDTIQKRVENDIKQLAVDGMAFGKLSLDGENVICYTPLAGKKAAETENAIYTSVETWYDGLYREYIKGILNYILKGEDDLAGKGRIVSEEDVTNLFITVANNNGIGGKDLETPAAKQEIAKQIKDYVIPRLKHVISHPYSAWVDDGVVTGMRVTRTIFNMDPRIPLGILCGGILILMVLIGGKTGLGFSCFSAFLASAAMLVAPLFRQRTLDELNKNLPQEMLDLGITETVLDQFLGFVAKYGLYCLAIGGILLVLRLIVQLISKKKNAAPAGDVPEQNVSADQSNL